jgi:predicted XRE-type DNA-binding protein
MWRIAKHTGFETQYKKFVKKPDGSKGAGEMTKRYDNVVDVLKSMDIPATQKKRQADYIKSRQLSRLLTVMRAQKKMSQKQASEKLEWSQGRVSKLETKEDRQISVGDLLDYSDALGMELSMVFLPKRMKIVDRVKLHAFEIVKLLHLLVVLSKGDSAMEQSVEQFHDECLSNLIGMVGGSQKSIRSKASKELTVIDPPQVEQMFEEEAERVASTKNPGSITAFSWK